MSSASAKHADKTKTRQIDAEHQISMGCKVHDFDLTKKLTQTQIAFRVSREGVDYILHAQVLCFDLLDIKGNVPMDLR